MPAVRFRDRAGSIRHGELIDGTITFGGHTYDPSDVSILAPTEPSKIIGVGLNYHSHAEEADMEIPDRPMLFLKGPNAVAGHGDTIPVPLESKRVDYEGEFGVVIDRQCRNVSAADATSVIRGYTCMNDVSDRHEQFNEQNWIRGKAFDSSAPFGPVVTPPEELPDDAALEVRVNGERKQHTTRDDMVFSIPELIEEITSYLTLEGGDVIATGTPGGIGPVSDRDTVEVEIDGVGVLENVFVDSGE